MVRRIFKATTLKPVILERLPDLQNGDVTFEPVGATAGSLIVDSSGKLVNLSEGVTYLPAGCQEASCAQTYSGSDPIQVDQMSVRFHLRPGLMWSDGSPLSADDSQYAFELARQLYPRVQPELLAYSDSYQALDAQTVEWRGVPGYRDGRYAGFFFSPLPRHAWSVFSLDQLLASDTVNRAPIGWGAYKIDEWTSGDHISLSRNPNYFRAGEGLPHFDRLVYRFLPDGDEALTALLAGECDYIDETAGLETQTERLLQLQSEKKAQVIFKNGTAWEHADFGIQPLAPDGSPRTSLFSRKEVRQAIAMCIDRERLAKELFFGQSTVPDTYVQPDHPLYNAEARKYPYDPQASARLLDGSGWIDGDQNPATPRLAQGIEGIPDGTPFAFAYLMADGPEQGKAAEIIRNSLAGCGIQVNIQSEAPEKLFASGPEGPIFGRTFDMAQFSWASSIEPACFLYVTDQIPGPYPQYPHGWGGANASGFSNPEYDQACQQARSILPDLPAYQGAHAKAQAIFAEELPAIPLYLRQKVIAARPDMCGVLFDGSADSTLWNIESFDYGPGCPPG